MIDDDQLVLGGGISRMSIIYYKQLYRHFGSVVAKLFRTKIE